LVVGLRAAGEARCRDNDDRNAWLNDLELSGYDVAGYVIETTIEDDTTDGGESGEDVEGFLAAVRREDVELGGFDHQLAGRDAAGKLPVDDEEAGSDHAEH